MMIKKNLLKDVKMKLAKLLHQIPTKKENLILVLLNLINGRSKIWLDFREKEKKSKSLNFVLLFFLFLGG